MQINRERTPEGILDSTPHVSGFLNKFQVEVWNIVNQHVLGTQDLIPLNPKMPERLQTVRDEVLSKAKGILEEANVDQAEIDAFLGTDRYNSYVSPLIQRAREKYQEQINQMRGESRKPQR